MTTHKHSLLHSKCIWSMVFRIFTASMCKNHHHSEFWNILILTPQESFTHCQTFPFTSHLSALGHHCLFSALFWTQPYKSNQTVFSKFIHVIGCIFHYFKQLWNKSTVWINHILFIRLSDDRHVSCFHFFLAIIIVLYEHSMHNFCPESFHFLH